MRAWTSLSTASGSLSPLRGVPTCPRGLLRRWPWCPHCPYEGYQRQDQAPHAPVQGDSHHRPYEGYQQFSADGTYSGDVRPHRPFEGCQQGEGCSGWAGGPVLIASTRGTNGHRARALIRPHCPYEGLPSRRSRILAASGLHALDTGGDEQMILLSV